MLAKFAEFSKALSMSWYLLDGMFSSSEQTWKQQMYVGFDIMFNKDRTLFKMCFPKPFLEILEESVFFDENKQLLIQDMGEENWLMTMTFLLLFFISLFYGILVTLIKVRETDFA